MLSGLFELADIAVQSGQRDDHTSSSELKTTGKEARAVLKEGVQRSERQQNGAGVIKEWESLISGSSQGDVSTSCITEVTNETRFSDLFSVEDTASSSSKGIYWVGVLPLLFLVMNFHLCFAVKII